MDTKMKVMNTKTKLFKITVQVVLIFAYIGYFFSLYKENVGNISAYTNYIILIVCLSGSLFGKTEKESKMLYILTKINCIIFIIWAIAMGVQLII